MAGLKGEALGGDISELSELLWSPEATLDTVAALPRPARELALAILGQGDVFSHGQEALAKAMGLSIRSVQRSLAILVEAKLAVEQRRQRPLPAVILLHPVVESYARLETVEPSRQRYERQTKYGRRRRAAANGPAPIIGRDHILYQLHVLLLPRATRPLPMPAAYLADFLTGHEHTACLLAAERGNPIADRTDLDEALRALFRRRLNHGRTRKIMQQWVIQMLDAGAERADADVDEQPAA
jgi:DNA-binding transcriptional ArsR family regulator